MPSSPKESPDVLADYVLHLERRGLSPRTLETYGECLRAFSRWLAEEKLPSPLAVSPCALMNFQVWLTQTSKRRGGHFSATYRATHITVVRGLYRWLHAVDLLGADLSTKLRLPKVPKRISRNILNAREIKKLIGHPDGSTEGLRSRVVLRLLVLSGPRISELAALDISDISLPDRELLIRHGKGNKDRLTFFDQETGRYLASYLLSSRPLLAGSEQQALILDSRGRRAKPSQLRYIVTRHARAARIGKPVTPHSLRHSFCTNMLRAGVNLKAIAELVGHSSLETTAKYTRVDIADLSAIYRTSHPLAGALPCAAK